MPSCLALIVAAGSGSRFGGDMPKQYLSLAGRPVLARTVAAFQNHPEVTAVRVVINPAHRDLYEEAVAGLDLPPPVAGGAARQDSVRNGLEAAAADGGYDLVLIHDAARPLVDAASISAVIKALGEVPAALAAASVSDTLKRADQDGAVAATVDRTALWRALTPQGFRFPDILKAHRDLAGQELTDDAAVAEKAGFPVRLVPTNPDNLKVTHAEDLARAEKIIMNDLGDVRVGHGYDVHKFTEGDHIVLCGLKVPHTHKLEGHSDADVGLHALTDAILGAISAGDIGSHFPPTDERWRGADSGKFLQHAASLVTAKGGVIAHCDITVICERPKVGPHREAMVARVAELLAIAPDRVSVKATTTEGLGFTGRREGIAAMATCTVRLPWAPAGA
ncbi:bifunctional 2-C-methyl-D-erythritol 4-phosphate cytidylyltransferase/2-C-methyl-D-erythritol 2,4-cyclodiphosphate synthase [Nitrospirillum sp. BR 11164]|uniref:bifunctional 2-C-methyl-D-erythritol 4-phosphate cytidylyltransferase/2-C-methyl-D-erythritol 2,4-cyclodiphosphate synthase n=1 Tax=Nitrospirillum sp. BR 11164 TaxID=3104324 RepID=UPI002B002C2D|nr:bifunctional 2-C-methyl-D-erythritol 4-phosphate cytidylyltransferase/2-C-methyl-D-erythritol 2,4-cyclodiphosphate synthase [Nitrospirillum sp. BR 11164]MEA1650735.1 bifunctional 2-C-methyl-D-erythritol 4-phosphate cytidylyltransferase/2-C-methyl-D-erythritol 2,4-cyclodiphosphate synthase [Nitrospirillum sp. BR 11164]